MYIITFGRTNYLKINLTDLRQIFRVGRTVDAQSETSLSIAHGTLPWQPISLSLDAAASGGRANVRLFPASSFSFFSLDFLLLFRTLHYITLHEETGQLHGERDNARNIARCTQARKTTHGLDGQRQDVERTLRGRVISQNDRGQG